MADLTPMERLQPSLLDRLTDDEPANPTESRDRRVLSVRKLRECVLRDLAWLLNTGNLGQTVDLRDYPAVATSVLNYGMPDIAGSNMSSADLLRLEQAIRQAVWDFEPRIIRNTIRIRSMIARDQMQHNSLSFEIEGELWSRPLPEHLYLRTEVDLETGGIRVEVGAGQEVS